MNKNWLVRTRKFQILGPISKGKVKELITLGKLMPDDEVSSGNGYWFFVSEGELLNKYLYGDIPQPFNIVAEADSVISLRKDGQTASMHSGNVQREEVIFEEDDLCADFNEDAPDLEPSGIELDSVEVASVISVPIGDDLEYPDMGMIDQITIDPASIKLGFAEAANDSPTSRRKEDDEEEAFEGISPKEGDLVYPDMGGDAIESNPQAPFSAFNQQEFEEVTEEFHVRVPAPEISQLSKVTRDGSREEEEKAKREKQGKKRSNRRSDLYLYVLLFIFSSFVIGIFLYYKKVLNSSLSEVGSLFFPSAHAQVITPDTKKKTYLNLIIKSMK